MKVGLDSYTIRELHLTPVQTLEYAKERGFDGVQFESVDTLCKDGLDKNELAEIKRIADDMELYTFVSVKCCNPLLFVNEDKDKLISSLQNQIEAAAYAGWRELRSEMGLLKNRKADPSKWPENLAASESVLKELVPTLKKTNCRINLELHTDSTSFEVLRVIEHIGSDFIGINLDTGNVILHGEYTPEVAKRVAPYTHLIHAKDVLVFEHEKGYLRQGCAPGRGIICWEQVLGELYKYNPNLCLSIEDHKNLFVVPVFEKEWYKDHPEASAYEIACILDHARQTSKKLSESKIQHYNEYEKVPYLEQMEDRLGFGLKYLKDVVKKLGYYS